MRPSIVFSSDSRVVRESSISDLYCTEKFVKSTLRLFLCNHSNLRITGISKSAEVKDLQVCFQTLNEF